MYETKKIVLSGQKIIDCTSSPDSCLRLNTHLSDSKYFLLVGLVRTPDEYPLAHAGVEIFLQKSSTEKVSVGITFTDKDGYFKIPLVKYPDYQYIVEIYPPV